MKRKTTIPFLLMIVLLFFRSVAPASEQSAESDDGFLSQFKNPVPGVEMGADFRFRVVYDNARKLDKKATGHDRINTRYRTRIWSKIKLSDDMDFNIRLTGEPRYYHRPPSKDKQLEKHEWLFDRFNLVWREPFSLPVTVKAGRQDIVLGSGFLILDGDPLDGGRTKFFDALRITRDWAEQNRVLDIIWIDDYGDSAKRLKPFNDRDLDLVEQDERGLILYLTDKTPDKRQIDGYFIYKNDHDRNRSSGYQGEIYTLGTFIKGDIGERWKYQMEFAPQFGHKNGKELNAFATSNKLTYHFNDENKNRVHGGYEYLSGNDDPDKNFDRVWGRCDDLCSKLYQDNIDSIDGRALDASNMHRLYAGWTTEPSDKLKFFTEYHLMFADDNTNAGGTGGLSKSGCFRGQLWVAKVDYKASNNISHRVEFEMFFPGDFYNDARNDVAVFARYGLVITW